MKDYDNETLINIAAKQELTHTHHLVLSLLYMPLTGKDAYALYSAMHGLMDRTSMRSPKYPIKFIYDITGLSPQTFLSARHTLEATGLLETYKDPQSEEYTFELYQPLSADAFIKDSPFAPYLKKRVGDARYEDLIGHFKITKHQRHSKENISVSFDEVFDTLSDHVASKKASYTQEETKKPSFNRDVDIDLVLEGLPQSIRTSKMKTKRFKEKLSEIAYLYRLNERQISDLMKANFSHGDVDLTALSDDAAKKYSRNKTSPIKKQAQTDSLAYLKQVHPRQMLEETTGSKAAKAEMATLEQLITHSGLPHEVINVLIAYVLHQLDNTFPSYGYFEKVAAEWKRSDVDSAEAAVEHIKKRKRNMEQRASNRKKPYKKQYNEKPEDTNVEWFDDYLKGQEE